jgi:hypothetical protein
MIGGAEASSLASNHRPATSRTPMGPQIVVADRADVRCITAITHLIDRSQSTILVQSPTLGQVRRQRLATPGLRQSHGRAVTRGSD